MEYKELVKEYYNAAVQTEWERIANRPEFSITCHYLDKYIKPGDSVLDIGGGPGRYSLHLAAKGCKVTLFDLAQANLNHAVQQAEMQNLEIATMCGDACIADTLLPGQQFDHVLLMGPLYHLLQEADRVQAVQACIKLLKPGGVFYASFISMIAGMIYAMKYAPELIASTEPSEVEYMARFMAGESFGGQAFTQAFFIDQKQVLPFMEQFPFKKLHLLGQESILAPCEENIHAQPREVVDAWLRLAETVCEREELLSWSEHLLYIGQLL